MTTFAEFNKQFDRFVKDVHDDGGDAVTLAMAKRGEQIAERFARRDVGGDMRFSGWRIGSLGDLEIKPLKGGGHILFPPRSIAGGWTVAEKGRNDMRGDPGGFQGPGVNSRTGETQRTKSGAVRKVRARKARRWNGTTLGKHTATDAVKAMQKEMPDLAEKAMGQVIRKHFG